MISTIIILVLMTLGLGLSLGKHGERKPDNLCVYNFWIDLIRVIIWMILFYYAGLFDKFFNGII